MLHFARAIFNKSTSQLSRMGSNLTFRATKPFHLEKTGHQLTTTINKVNVLFKNEILLSRHRPFIPLHGVGKYSSFENINASTRNQAKKEYNILSIDGGGIRGLIPAMVLTEIEKRTGKPIVELFDYIAGTSTGGILALGLNAKSQKNNSPLYKAEDLVAIYEKHGEKIFDSVTNEGISLFKLTAIRFYFVLSSLFISGALYQYLKNEKFGQALKKIISEMNGSDYELLYVPFILQLLALFFLFAIPSYRKHIGYFITLSCFGLVSTISFLIILEEIKKYPEERDEELVTIHTKISKEQAESLPKDTPVHKRESYTQVLGARINETIYYVERQVTVKEARELGVKENLVGAAFAMGNILVLIGFWAFLMVYLLISKKYHHAAVEKLMKMYFNDTLISSSLKETFIVSYDVKNRIPAFFTKSAALKNPEKDFLMREVARATSAAPTYFDPLRKDNAVFVDGGIFANNPTLHAYLDGIKHANERGIYVISIGTGAYKPKETSSFKNFGLLQWILTGRLIKTMMEAASESTHIQMVDLLGEANYKRIQIELNKNVSLDQADTETISELKKWGHKCIQENDALIEEICHRLLKNSQNNDVTEKKENPPDLKSTTNYYKPA